LFKFWTHGVLEPPLRGLGSTYTIHLRLIGKRVVGFLLVVIVVVYLLLLVLIELFARYFGCSTTSEKWIKNRRFARGAVFAKFARRGGRLPQSFSHG